MRTRRSCDSERRGRSIPAANNVHSAGMPLGHACRRTQIECPILPPSHSRVRQQDFSGLSQHPAVSGFGGGLRATSSALPFDRALEAGHNLTRGTARRQFACRPRSGSNCT